MRSYYALRPLSPSPTLPIVSALRLSLSLLLAIVAAPLTGQDDPDEDDSPYRPGLVARYVADGRTATRLDETLAFDWQDSPPDRRLPSGNFSASWTGRLWTQVAGEHRLAVFVGGGKVALRVAGQEIITDEAAEPAWVFSQPLTLDFDRHPLEVTFEKTGEQARLGLFWSGPGFVLEPVSERFLMHDREQTVPADFERGRRLAAALRCNACHGNEDSREALPAPALDKLSGNVHADWLVDWLSTGGESNDGRESEAPAEPRLLRRMPHFGLTKEDAADIAAWLIRLPPEKQPEGKQQEIEPKGAKSAKGGKGTTKNLPPQPAAGEGERLLLTLGCLACHQHGELGESGLFGGGDLTSIAAKRPPKFFARWLADPASLNRNHRMPIFDLSPGQRESLALWLESQGKSVGTGPMSGDPAAGERLVTRLRCASCHALPGIAASPKPAGLKPLAAASDWSRSCGGEADLKGARPGYRFSAKDQAALKTYFTALGTPQRALPTAPQTAGKDLLVELNCLACHAREGISRPTNSLPARLQDKLTAVVDIHDEFGKQVPAMTPPALNSVGDKLHDSALAAAILRKDKPHRPYLMVQMPKFSLSDEQLAALTAYFTVTDRIPRGAGVSPANSRAGETPAPQLAAAGPRLVTTDGFGCTSCHPVGELLPDKAPLNARGPDLSMLNKRIRREWFNRWCNNPARIVPRMEMPSVQIPVRGVLGEQIDDQLAAVWHILNTPGFQPPEPNPVRVLRLSGVPERNEQPIVLHDVIKSGDKTYLFPVVIGLPNRHNVLFDLETNRLAAWWLGDAARQRTKGKSWYWEQGAESIFDPRIEGSDLTLVVDGKELQPRRAGQFAATVDYLNRAGTEGLVFARNVLFELPTGKVATVRILERVWRPKSAADRAAFVREVSVSGVPESATARLRVANLKDFRQTAWDVTTNTLTLPGTGGRSIHIKVSGRFESSGSGTFDLLSTPQLITTQEHPILIEYRSDLSADQYVADPPPFPPLESISIEIAPGFAARRLPLPDDIMPSALDWKPDGRLVFTTLKGQVFVASDTNEDSLEDKLRLLDDGLATPYGLAAASDHADVLVKSGLFRLVEADVVGLADRRRVVAAGWGVTEDYHDWAVGLVRGERGEYYIGLPCQQDNRSEAAAKHRGQLLKLVPREATPENPRLFDIKVVSSGHRFPMGLARNRDGELFVTDNQGNYNPFNELNHVRPGMHFGFINEIEKKKGFMPPPLAKPAIDIPHPWTRSVNGICFLETPASLRKTNIFGPLEGHLIGCEYDTRQLIRMTLQKVGDTYQGVAYPLSIPPENVENGLLGPIVCAVSPRGELYVGNIRDSGWGAGNNIGDIVQIKLEPEKLPCGIAEVRATKDGFTLDFFRPVDRAKAESAGSYSIASYRRESTPAYGGPNLERRIEKISAVEVSPDAKRVTIQLSDLRAGFVYEFQLKPLVHGKEPFHPAEAHYTLNRVP